MIIVECPCGIKVPMRPQEFPLHCRCGRIYPKAGAPAISRGLGDTVAKVTQAFGIKPCGGCKKRQEKLNEVFPYKS